MASLFALKAKELLERFIRETVTSSYDGSENAELCRSAHVLDDAKAAGVLSALMEARMRDKPAECVDLLLALTVNPDPSFRKVATAVIVGLDSIAAPKSDPDSPLFWRLQALRGGRRQQSGLAPACLVKLFSALRHFKTPSLGNEAADKIASRPEVFAPVAMVVPAIERVFAESGLLAPPVDRAVQRLWMSAAEFLLRRSEVPPQLPPDWSLQAKLSCTCADCQELQAFARDPSERVHRFRVKKERRSHLHQAIDRHRLDMTHVTDRAGSPQTLVCTKDRRTYHARMKEYQAEIAAMGTLVKLAPKVAGAGGLCRRMEAAAKAGTI